MRPVDIMRRIGIRYPLAEPAVVMLYRLRSVGSSVRMQLRRRSRHAREVALDSLQIDLVTSLSREGIAIVPIDKLVGAGTKARLIAAAEKTLSDPRLRTQIENGKGQTGKKEFVIRAFGEPPVVPGNDPFLTILLSERLLQVVNHYLSDVAKLQSTNLWYSVPVPCDAPAISSQRWHRDYDDRTILKAFLYLVDVDVHMGPLEYIRESQPGGRYEKVFPQRPPFGATPSEGSVERAIPTEQHLVGTGPAGTLLLCDTTGLHRGGRSTTAPRLLYYGAFTTRAAIEKPLLEVVGPFSGRLSCRARAAVRGIKGGRAGTL